MALKKVINSATQQFEPVLVDKLVLDAVPTVNSFNSVTSDAVARAVAGASGEVPQVTESDNGKVLKAVYDAGGPAVEWAEDQGGASYTAGDGITISDQDVISATTRLTTANAKYLYDLESDGVYPATVSFRGFGLNPFEPTPLRSLTFDSVHTTVDGNQFSIYLVYNLNGVPPTNLRMAGELIINSGMPSGLAYSAGTVLCYPAKPDLYSTITLPSQISLPGGQIVEDTYSINTVSSAITSDAEQYTQYVVKIQGGGAPADVPTLVSYFENNGSTALTVKLPDEVEYLVVNAPDQTYDASSTNAQSGVAVAEAIAAIPAPSVDEVPDVTSSDDGKVLTASYSGGSGSYSWQTAQGGGGGASVEAGAGLVKSGDTLSVNYGDGLQIGSLTAGQYSSPSYVYVPGANISGINVIKIGDSISQYWSNTDTPAKAYIFISEQSTRPTIYGRYTGLEFDIVRDGNYLSCPSAAGVHFVDFSAENIEMSAGHTLSELAALQTVEIQLGFYWSTTTELIGLNYSNPVVYDGKSLQLTNPLPSASGGSYRKMVLMVKDNGAIGWEKSVFNPVYVPYTSTKPTYNVSNNKMTIVARTGSSSVNSPLVDNVSGIVGDSSHKINRLVLVSPTFSIESDSAKSGTRVTLKTTYHFTQNYAYTGEFDMVFFDTGVRGDDSVVFNCTHNLYMMTNTSSPAIEYISYELTDDEGTTVAFASSNQLTNYSMATQRLPY